VYVRPFPDVNGGRWQVSTGGGAEQAAAPPSLIVVQQHWTEELKRLVPTK